MGAKASVSFLQLHVVACVRKPKHCNNRDSLCPLPLPLTLPNDSSQQCTPPNDSSQQCKGERVAQQDATHLVISASTGPAFAIEDANLWNIGQLQSLLLIMQHLGNVNNASHSCIHAMLCGLSAARGPFGFRVGARHRLAIQIVHCTSPPRNATC